MAFASACPGEGLTDCDVVPILIIGASLVDGFAGKVENGPSCTERLLGGRPLSLPLSPLLPPCHALDTARPCLFLDRGDLFALMGPADLGSSTEGVIGNVCRIWIADCGYGVDGVVVSLVRQRNCWPPALAFKCEVDGERPEPGVFGAIAT